MFVETVYSDFSVRLRTAKFIYWLFESYSSFRYNTKAFLKKQLLMILMTPLYPLLGLTFLILRKQVARTGRLKFRKFDSVEDYVHFRELLDSFKKYEPVFQNASKLDKNSGGFLFKFCCNQLVKLSTTLVHTNKQLLKHLEQYNKPQFKMTNSYQFVPEEKLWAERNPAYTLWL